MDFDYERYEDKVIDAREILSFLNARINGTKDEEKKVVYEEVIAFVSSHMK